MITDKDYWCKIMITTPEEREIQFKQLQLAGIDPVDANRLLDSKWLEIRKMKSGRKGMEHCAVVRCDRGGYFNVPTSILERTDRK